jgi:ComF family protein
MTESPDQSQPVAHDEAWEQPGLRLLSNWLHTAAEWVFPPRCALCGRVDTVLCARCAKSLPAPTLTPTPALPPLIASAATGIYEGKLRRIIHVFKYESDRTDAQKLAPVLAERLCLCLAALAWTIDTIIPVPLHTTRQRERGYNQSQLLGVHVASELKLPINLTALTRQRATPSQVGLTAAQRQTNLHDAFYAPAASLYNLSILLIDDVSTTGATLQACARAATLAGARAVYSLTLAFARV